MLQTVQTAQNTAPPVHQQLDPRCCGEDGPLISRRFCQPESHFIHFLFLRADINQARLLFRLSLLPWGDPAGQVRRARGGAGAVTV